MFEAQRDLTYLLSDFELRQVQALNRKYQERFGRLASDDPDCCFFLGDSASYAVTWSAISGRIPTYRRNPGKFWFPHLKRWMLPVEKAASLGLPVTLESASVMGIPKLPVLDLQRADSVCGNAMHYANTTVILLIGLTCFGPSREEALIDWTKLAK